MDSKSFLDGYQVTDIEKDPLPIKVLRHAITKDEIEGQAAHWGFDYLDQRSCPIGLMQIAIKKLRNEIRQTDFSHCAEATEDSLDGNENANNEILYEPLKLMQAIVKKLDEICMKEKEDYQDSVDGIVEPPDMQPHVFDVSYNNIKNSRRYMEDRMTILPRMDRIFDLSSPVSYFAVFDGHNGSEAAAYGAAQLHQFLIRSMSQQEDVISSISDAIESLDETFIQKCSGKVKSGSTVVLSLIVPGKLYVAWLGDSQAVLVKQNEVSNLVTPHKPERKDEIDRIRNLGGEVIQMHDTYRVNGNLAVSRAIGDADQKTFIISTPDIKMLELDGSEEFLILACDGLWDEISPDAAAQIVRRQVVSDAKNVPAISQKLVQQAKQKGSQDNISVIVVFLEPVESIKNRYEGLLEPTVEPEVAILKQSLEPFEVISLEKFIGEQLVDIVDEQHSNNVQEQRTDIFEEQHRPDIIEEEQRPDIIEEQRADNVENGLLQRQESQDSIDFMMTPKAEMLAASSSESFDQLVVTSTDWFFTELAANPEANSGVLADPLLPQQNEPLPISDQDKAKVEGLSPTVTTAAARSVPQIESDESFKNRYEDLLEPTMKPKVAISEQSADPFEVISMEKFIGEQNVDIVDEQHSNNVQDQRVDIVEVKRTDIIAEEQRPDIEKQRTDIIQEQQSPDTIEDQRTDIIEEQQRPVIIEEQRTDIIEDQQRSNVIEEQRSNVIEEQRSDVIEEQRSDVIEEQRTDIIEEQRTDIIEEQRIEEQQCSDVIEEQQRPVIIEEQQCSDVIEEQQRTDVIEEQLTDIIEEQQRPDAIEEQQRPDAIEEQQRPDVIEEKRADIIEDQHRPNIIEEQRSDIIEEQRPNIIEEQRSDIIEEQRPNIIEEQRSDIIEDQQRPNIIEEQRTDTIEEKRSDVIEEHRPDTIKEQRTDTIEEQRTDTIEEQRTDVIEEQRADNAETGLLQRLESKDSFEVLMPPKPEMLAASASESFDQLVIRSTNPFFTDLAATPEANLPVIANPLLPQQNEPVPIQDQEKAKVEGLLPTGTTTVPRSAPKTMPGVASKAAGTKSARTANTKTTGASRIGAAASGRSAGPKNVNGTEAKPSAPSRSAPSSSTRTRPTTAPVAPKPALTKPTAPKTTSNVPSTTSPKRVPAVGGSTTARPPTSRPTTAATTSKVGDAAAKPASGITRTRPKPTTTTTATAAAKPVVGGDVKKTTTLKPTTSTAKPIPSLARPPPRTIPMSQRMAPPKPPTATTRPLPARTATKPATDSSKNTGTTAKKPITTTTTTRAAAPPPPKTSTATKKVESSVLKAKKPSPTAVGKSDATSKTGKSAINKKVAAAASEGVKLIQQNGLSSKKGNADVNELNAINGAVNGSVNGGHNGINGETEKQDPIKENGIHLDDDTPSLTPPTENFLASSNNFN